MENKTAIIFELYRDFYDEGDQWLFTHPESKTETQFKDDVHSLMRKYAAEYTAQEEVFCGMDNFIRFIAPKLKELGYAPVETTRVGFFAGSILEEKDDATAVLEIIIGKDIWPMVDKNRLKTKALHF